MSSWKEHKENEHEFMYDHDGNVVSNSQSQMMMSCASSSSSPPTLTYIQHPISKLDTLPGIAIKYGIKVADVKKVNGLVTDSQMFGLKTLHIPLHGRHCLPNGSNTTGHDNPDNARYELFESFQSLRMKTPPVIRSNNGSKPTMKKSASEIFSIAEYQKRASKSSENGSFYRNSPMSHSHSHHKKSRSLANGASDDIMEVVNHKYDKSKGTLIRRNYKSEANLQRIPELLLKQDNSSNGGFSSRSAKGLAQRQKVASNRIALTAYSKQAV